MRPSRRPAPLADHELYALLRHFLPGHPQGRRVAELRTRLDAVFWIAATDLPWSALPARFGRPDTVHRWFRRQCHAGSFHGILHALHDAPASDPIQRLAPRLLRACRRAAGFLGEGFVRLIQRLGLLEALPGPPWMLPNPLLARTLLRLPLPVSLDDPRTGGALTPLYVRWLMRLHRFCVGRARVPRRLRLDWC